MAGNINKELVVMTNSPSPIERVLVRTAQLRVLALEEAVEQYSVGDPERQRVRAQLFEERNKLNERLQWLRSR